MHQFFPERRRAPTPSAMRNAIRSLSAQAKFEGDQHEVHLRAADFLAAGSTLILGMNSGERWKSIRLTGGSLNPPCGFGALRQCALCPCHNVTVQSTNCAAL